MNIEASVNKLFNPIEKHASLLGIGISVFSNLQPNFAGTSGTLGEDINALLNGQLHAPEWNNILNVALKDANTMSALMVAIAGYFTKGMTSNSTLNSISEIAYKAGLGYWATNMLISGIYYSTHSPPMGGSISSTSSQTGNYTNQPLQGSTLNQSGMQNLAPYQSVYSGRPTAGSLYTVASGSRLVGN